MILLPYAIGIIVLLILWFIYYLGTGEKDFRKYFMGADGVLSTSKFQIFIWTIVIIFAYVTIFSARALNEDFMVLSTLPENLLIVMGITVTTTATAKGITANYAKQKKIIKKPSNNDKSIGPLFQDDQGDPDLSKIQMLAQTFIAIGIYIIRLIYEVEKGNINIPDIDTAFMVLMGLGQGAYIGKKITTSNIPNPEGIQSNPKSPKEITINGTYFGKDEKDGSITINNQPIPSTSITKSTNKSIKLKIPDKDSDGNKIPEGKKISIGLRIASINSPNQITYTIPKNSKNKNPKK